jgi:hypothetical protein
MECQNVHRFEHESGRTTANVVTFIMVFVFWISTATAGGYVDLNGFRYVLANTGVDADVVDFSGDDCSAFPCQPFPIPDGCNATSPTFDVATVAQAKKWSTSFLVAADGLYPVTNWMLAPQPSFALLDLATYPGFVALGDPVTPVGRRASFCAATFPAPLVLS